MFRILNQNDKIENIKDCENIFFICRRALVRVLKYEITFVIVVVWIPCNFFYCSLFTMLTLLYIDMECYGSHDVYGLQVKSYLELDTWLLIVISGFWFLKTKCKKLIFHVVLYIFLWKYTTVELGVIKMIYTFDCSLLFL